MIDASHGIKTKRDVGVDWPGDAAEDISLGDERREVARDAGSAGGLRMLQHVRKTRMDGQCAELSPVRGNHSAVVDRVQFAQQLDGLGEPRGRRSVEPLQLERIGHTGSSKIQNERREVGADLRRRVCEQMRVLMIRPQTVADASAHAPRATSALIRRRARLSRCRDASFLFAASAECATGRVDHYANAFDRSCLGDRRRQHDLPPAVRIGLDARS